MKKIDILKGLILELLAEDNETFEAIYFFVNGRTYKNMQTNCYPLYRDLDELHEENDMYLPMQVYGVVKDLIAKDFIKSYKINEDNAVTEMIQVNNPEFDNFSEFALYWFEISDKGSRSIDDRRK
ncbi:MAG: hypothetical protein ACE5HI_09920 [bacterium]